MFKASCLQQVTPKTAIPLRHFPRIVDNFTRSYQIAIHQRSKTIPSNIASVLVYGRSSEHPWEIRLSAEIRNTSRDKACSYEQAV
jgi:hypothetical protein